MAGTRPTMRAILPRPLLSGLWHQPNFLMLWTGQTISLLGSSVTLLALPLTAVDVLGVGAMQMGLLAMAGRLPFLLFGLPAGVWVDRLRPRRILIAANIGQALFLASIPVAAALGVLEIAQLYAVAFFTGTLTVFFDIAYMTYLPALVDRKALIEGNSKLATSDSLASVAGPSFGGWLVQLMTAPTAIAIDVFSFMISSACLARIREPNPERVGPRERPGFREELIEGLQTLLRHRILRDGAAATAILNFFGSVQAAVFVLYLARDLNLDPATIGLIFGVFGVGGLIGAAVADRAGRRFGFGLTLVGTTAVAGTAALLVPVAHWVPSWAMPLLVVSQGLFGTMMLIYNVNMLTLRQGVTPERVLGRVTATTRFMTWGIMPIGALVGGAVGEIFGLAPTLVICALGMLLAPAWLLSSPVRRLRDSGNAADSPGAESQLAGP